MAKSADADSFEAWWEEVKASRPAKLAGRFVRGPLREWALVGLRWCRDHPLGAVSIAFGIVLLNLFSSGGAALLTAMAPILGLPLLAFAGYAMWRRAKAMEDQVAALREGQVDDRFVKAVAQLGDEKLPIRMGGIYALGKIARKNPDAYHEIVLEVLSAFLLVSKGGSTKKAAAKLPADHQAATLVISRCTTEWELANAQTEPDIEHELMPDAELALDEDIADIEDAELD